MTNPLKQCVLSAAILAVLAVPSWSSANDEVQKLSANPSNWVTWGGNYAGTRYSPLDQINSDNVKNLKPAWTFSTGVLRGHEGGALVVNDVIYIHTPFPNTVYALDQKTHSVIWEYTPQQNADTTIAVMCCDTVNRGLALSALTVV